MKKHHVRRLLAVAAAVAPISLLIYSITRHGMIDYVESYTPLQRNFVFLLTAGVLSLAVLIVDLVRRNKEGRAADIVTGLIWGISVISILMSAAFAGYILLPRFSGSVNIPPQLVIVDPPPGQKTPGLAVTFYTAVPTKNTVLWGETNGTLKSVTEKIADRKHVFRLDGLKPGREYMYTVNDGQSAIFRTPPAAGQPIWFAAAGDAHVGNETSRPDLTDKMLAEIAKPTNGYAMFFSLGDQAQLGFSKRFWDQFGAEFSPFTRSIPTAYVPGNHDMMLGGDTLYKRYVSQNLWQRVDVNDAHFLLLDLEWKLQTYTPAEKAWLEIQLKSIKKKDWTIVMCHTFFYSSGAPDEGWDWFDNSTVINEFAPLFEKYDVDLVISGHKHQAEVLENKGVTYIIVGTLGGQPDTVLEYKSPASKWLRQGAYGFVDVTLAGEKATITFRDPDYKILYSTKINR